VPKSDLNELLGILDLSEVGDDLFTGRQPRKNPIRTFGGQQMAQAFVAASRTVADELPPSQLAVHFGRGLEHGFTAPVVPDPLDLPTIDELLVGYENVVPAFVDALRPIEWRYTNDPAWVMRHKGDRLDINRVWMTAAGAMPEDPVLHTAAMIYSSDTTVLDSIITTHGLSWGWDRIFAVTINHSVWFHRQVDFSEWVLYSTASPAAADSRGLGMGHFFNRAGEVVATVAQEGIVKHFGKSGRD